MPNDLRFLVMCLLLLLFVAVAFGLNGVNVGRCQSACWLAGYSYVSTDAAACLCDNAGVPVAVAVPEAPHGR